MKLLHVLVEDPGGLAGRIAEAQSADHEVEIVDLSQEGISYEAVIDAIFFCDRVISW